MSTPLQEFSPDKSSYERPTLPWVCGRASEGCPCHIGPTISGECQANLECNPYRDGDGFRCARPPAWGGACEKGPLPDGSCCQTVILCQPKRSTRARRKIVSMCSAGFVLGVLLLAFGSDPDIRYELLSPGELTLQHHTSRQKCSDCHSQADLGIDGLTGARAELDPDSGEPTHLALQDSRKCLSCHNLGDTPLNPHSLAVGQLTDLNTSAQLDKHADTAPWLVSVAADLSGGPTSPLASDELACSLCHKEHRGKFFDLTKLADAQCQVCHTKQFHGFAAGHPEFDGFPYSRRTRIRFDHTTHYGTHFANFKRLMPNGVAPESCRSCHQPDASRRMMPVVSFEKACASCHEEQMQGPFTDVAFFAIPDLEIGDQPVGDWPAGVTLTSPEDLPAFMKVLLSTQPEWREGQQILKHAEDDSASQRGHTRLAIATKSLLGDLTENGEQAVRKRLLQAMGDSGNAKIASSLASATAPMVDSLRTASRQWFPNLKDEWQTLGGDAPPPKVDSAVNLEVATSLNKGWHIGDSQSVVRYRPSRHADPVPRELIDALTQIRGIAEEPDGNPSMDALRSLFRDVTDPRASFRCTKCHSVEEMKGGAIAANWQALSPESAQRNFVAFSHAPHVTLLGSRGKTDTGIADQDCRTCHLLEELDGRDRTFIHPQYENPLWSVNLDADTPGCSGFLPTRKAVCAECHVKQRAGDSCLKCHNYHVGSSHQRAR